MSPALPPLDSQRGTVRWGWDMLRGLSSADQEAVERLIAKGLDNDITPSAHRFPSLSRIRMDYSTLVFARSMDGHTARLVWDILQAIVGAAEKDDIPF